MKKLFPLVFLFICPILIKGQNNITLSTQEDIDQFSINYPDLHSVDVLKINGLEITDLSGLHQLEEIQRYIYISETSIQDLRGLENITVIDPTGTQQGGIYLFENPELESIEAIADVLMPEKWGRISIGDNPKLATCGHPFVCDMVARHQVVWLFNNAPGCDNIHEVQLACDIDVSPLNGPVLFEESFENWVEGVPVGYDIELVYTDGLANIERVPALSDGDYAVLLRSNVPHFEGNFDTWIDTSLTAEYPSIDLSMTYRCLGEGWCTIGLGQGFIDSSGVNQRSFLHRWAGDSTTFTFVARNINPNEPFDIFNRLQLMASPVWTPVGSFGVSEFIIDDIKITGPDTSSTIENFEPQQWVYPNPSTGQIYFKNVPQNLAYTLYDMKGSLISKGRISNELLFIEQKGMFYLQLSDPYDPNFYQVARIVIH